MDRYNLLEEGMEIVEEIYPKKYHEEAEMQLNVAINMENYKGMKQILKKGSDWYKSIVAIVDEQDQY